MAKDGRDPDVLDLEDPCEEYRLIDPDKGSGSTLKGAEFERAQDRAADTVKQAAAETLQQTSDRLQELASALRSPEARARGIPLRVTTLPRRSLAGVGRSQEASDAARL